MGYPELAAWLKADANAPADAEACATYLNSTSYPQDSFVNIAQGTLGAPCSAADVLAARTPKTTSTIVDGNVTMTKTYGWA